MVTDPKQRREAIDKLVGQARKTFGKDTTKNPTKGPIVKPCDDNTTIISGNGGSGGLYTNVSNGNIISAGITSNNLSVDNMSIEQLTEKAEKILLTFDMHYIDTVLSKCTEEHMKLLLKHLDHVKLMIEKKILERR